MYTDVKDTYLRYMTEQVIMAAATPTPSDVIMPILKVSDRTISV